MDSAVETHESVEEIASQWDALVDRAGSSPFVRPAWVRAWYRAFGEGSLEILAAHRGDELTGVLPLVNHRGVLSSAANWHTPLFGAAGGDGEALATLAAAVLERRPRRLDLSFLDPESQFFQQLSTVTDESGVDSLRRVVRSSPYLDLDSDWPALESRLSGHRRRRLRALRRQLDKQGNVTFEVSEGREGLEGLLDEGFRIEALGWKGRRGTAIASERATESFYREVASWAAERRSLRLWFLRVDGRPIAFAYGLDEDGIYYDVKVGFDPGWGKFAPGVLLLRERLRQAVSKEGRRFEFLGGPEPHKLDWTETCHGLLRVQVFARTPAGLASRLAWRYGRPAARRGLALARRSSSSSRTYQA